MSSERDGFNRKDGVPGENRSILDRVAEAFLRNDGAPSEAKSNADRLSDALSQVLSEYARTHGISLQEAFNEMVWQSEEKATRELWGPLPDEYDPRKDDSHPSRGQEAGR